MKVNENKLDQFYTNDNVAEYCLDIYLNFISSTNIFFIEPSAGGGSFLRALKKRNKKYFACDIEPKYETILKCDYTSTDIKKYLPKDKIIYVIGNPPFGKKSLLAVEFINRSFYYSDTVGFVLPIQFRKFFTQRKINEKACLINDTDLELNSFNYNDKPYSVRCCFQIWQINSKYKNLRMLKSPETKHEDFEMWQYNYTEDALKFFNKDEYKWDFAVFRQGYYDYAKRIYNEEELDKRKQYIFFKARNKEILERLLKLDYETLSKKNTSTPGFGKADVIELYNKKYPKNKNIFF